MAALQRSTLFETLQRHDADRTAVVHSLSGRSFTYGSLLHDVAAAKERLLRDTGRDDKSIVGERIAFLVENSYDYVGAHTHPHPTASVVDRITNTRTVTLLSILASNAIALPLAPSFPPSELRYILNHSEALALFSTGKYIKLAAEVLSEGLDTSPISGHIDKTTAGSGSKEPIQLVGDSYTAEGGLMLYTSGTTARPKGVLLPHLVLIAQAQSLLQAWSYSSSDRLLHVLPLHHIHGTVNALIAPLLAGSTIEFMFPFNPTHVWSRFASPFLPAAP